jgi:hypothetical protein
MIGALGLVEVRSRLGRETLVWVMEGGPAVAFRDPPDGGPVPDELLGDAMFPGIVEGWAWADGDWPALEHLDLSVFRHRILQNIGAVDV